jgi:hypothetical protein
MLQKVACESISSLFFNILNLKDVSEPLLIETLCCIRNFVANCDRTKRLLIEPVRSTKYSTTVLDSVILVLQANSVNDDTFFAACEVIKILALFSETRMYLLKVMIISSTVHLNY